MTYIPELLDAARDQAWEQLGEGWFKAVEHGHHWLAYREDEVIVRGVEGGSVQVNSTSGETYVVAGDGSSCTCPAYSYPANAGEMEKIRACKHRGAVHVDNRYQALLKEQAQREQYRLTFSAEVPYIPGVNYSPLAWVGTEHEAAERQRLGDDVVDAAIAERETMRPFDRSADIDARTAWAEQLLNGAPA